MRLLLLQTSRMLQGCSSYSGASAADFAADFASVGCIAGFHLSEHALARGRVSQASQIWANLPQRSLVPQKQWNFCSMAFNGAVRDIIIHAYCNLIYPETSS